MGVLVLLWDGSGSAVNALCANNTFYAANFFILNFNLVVAFWSTARRQLASWRRRQQRRRIKENVTNDALSALVVQLSDRNGANSARSLYDIMPEMLRQTTTTKLTVVSKQRRKPTL